MDGSEQTGHEPARLLSETVNFEDGLRISLAAPSPLRPGFAENPSTGAAILH
jgi:hypothetical protein